MTTPQKQKQRITPVPLQERAALATLMEKAPTTFFVMDDLDADFITTKLPSLTPLLSVFGSVQLFRVQTEVGTFFDVTVEEDRIRNAYVVFLHDLSLLRRKQLGVLYQSLAPTGTPTGTP